MAAQVAEKPPLYRGLPGDSLPSTSKPTRVGKLLRSAPVSTQRTNSPSRLRSLRKPRQRTDSNSDSDSDISGEDQAQIQEPEKCLIQLQTNSTTHSRDKTNKLDVVPPALESQSQSLQQKSNFKKTHKKSKNNSRLISIEENFAKKVNDRDHNSIPRRHTEVVTSNDSKRESVCIQQTKNGPNKSIRRHTADAASNELFMNETKLVVLEYLSSLTPDQITARNKTSRSNSSLSRRESQNNSSVSHSESRYDTSTVFSSCDSVSCVENNTNFDCELNVGDIYKSQKPNQITIEEKSKTLPKDLKKRKPSNDQGTCKKANTVTIGEHERKQLLEQLAIFNAEQERLHGKKHLMRSSSDVTEENWANVRRKLQQMKVPIKQWISSNMKREIATFDTNKLKKNPFETIDTDPSYKPPRPLSILIPKHHIEDFEDEAVEFTPQTYAVNRLEEMSTEIMKDFPDLLLQHVSDLLTPLQNNKIISYESFASIAKDVYNKKLLQVSGSVWTRVALVLYTVKETIFSGNLDDTQLELLVEYSTKFVTENAEKSLAEIENSMDLESTMFNASGLIYRNISSDEEELPELERKLSQKQSYEDLSIKQKISHVVNDWTPFGVAALAIGIGLAYSYVKP